MHLANNCWLKPERFQAATETKKQKTQKDTLKPKTPQKNPILPHPPALSLGAPLGQELRPATTEAGELLQRALQGGLGFFRGGLGSEALGWPYVGVFFFKRS